MGETTTRATIEAIRRKGTPLTGSSADYDPLMELIGDSRFVLLGEASHGTHEFYRHRCEITKRLIREKGFTIVAVEADWPDAYLVNRYIRAADDGMETIDALDGFQRFPTWMWRNTDVLNFIGWLRDHNDGLPTGTPKTGFYGIDLYSLHASIQAVLGYLERVDPEEAKSARHRYACFDHYGKDSEAYGLATAFDTEQSCEGEVVSQLMELQRRRNEYSNREGGLTGDEYFFAEQNARLVKNAEEYYRTIFRGQVSSWNVRDSHMAESLEALVRHSDNQGIPAKAVIWAHNSHLGDARATEMARRGELNLGQIIRTRHNDTVLVGFSTYEGTVTAADNWDEAPQHMKVRPALPGSYEELFHEAGVKNVLVNLREQGELRKLLAEPRLERAIGVIYRPETERMSHYFHASLSDQFDAMIHIDHTRGVEPLEHSTGWHHDSEEVPEIFPSSL